MIRAHGFLTLALATLAACTGSVNDDDSGGSGSDNGSGGGPAAGTPQPIAKLQCLRKMALDLTHTSPTLEDLQALDSGNTTLEELAEKYLASPEFKKVSFDWMRSEFPPTALTTMDTDIEEPARLMHHVLMNDRDWREIMTATYTVDAGGNELPITDRPAAGILSTKYSLQSTVGSFRRNWAGRFERQFVGITLVAVTLPPGDMTDVSPDGLASNPNCAGCHVHPTYGIDPLAKFADCYDENGERKAGCVDPESTFLLQTGKGLPDLGRITANTNEFKSQGVDFFFKRLFGRDLAKSEAGFYSDAAAAFTASGWQARALIKHLVTSEAYCSR
jgi:hypothetical protein